MFLLEYLHGSIRRVSAAPCWCGVQRQSLVTAGWELTHITVSNQAINPTVLQLSDVPHCHVLYRDRFMLHSHTCTSIHLSIYPSLWLPACLHANPTLQHISDRFYWFFKVCILIFSLGSISSSEQFSYLGQSLSEHFNGSLHCCQGLMGDYPPNPASAQGHMTQPGN